MLLIACHFLLSSITLRNYRNGTLFAVVEADKDSRKQGTPDPRDTKGFYKALNVERDADQKKIKSAYRKLALKYHVSISFHFFSSCIFYTFDVPYHHQLIQSIFCSQISSNQILIDQRNGTMN